MFPVQLMEIAIPVRRAFQRSYEGRLRRPCEVEYHGATMTFEIDQGAYGLLLRLVLAQRLEINAIESALKNAGVLADSQIQEIRLQASKAAEIWSRDGGIDLLGLIRVHSSPNANMLMPLSQEVRDELRREINGHAPRAAD